MILWVSNRYHRDRLHRSPREGRSSRRVMCTSVRDGGNVAYAEYVKRILSEEDFITVCGGAPMRWRRWAKDMLLFSTCIGDIFEFWLGTFYIASIFPNVLEWGPDMGGCLRGFKESFYVYVASSKGSRTVNTKIKNRSQAQECSPDMERRSSAILDELKLNILIVKLDKGKKIPLVHVGFQKGEPIPGMAEPSQRCPGGFDHMESSQRPFWRDPRQQGQKPKPEQFPTNGISFRKCSYGFGVDLFLTNWFDDTKNHWLDQLQIKGQRTEEWILDAGSATRRTTSINVANPQRNPGREMLFPTCSKEKFQEIVKMRGSSCTSQRC